MILPTHLLAVHAGEILTFQGNFLPSPTFLTSVAQPGDILVACRKEEERDMACTGLCYH